MIGQETSAIGGEKKGLEAHFTNGRHPAG